jgi:hypothetical protein
MAYTQFDDLYQSISIVVKTATGLSC